MTFGEKLKQLRENNGWTLNDVIEKLGIKTISTYSNYEYGLREPSYEMLKKIANMYEVSIDYLLGNEKESKSKLDELYEKLVVEDEQMIKNLHSIYLMFKNK